MAGMSAPLPESGADRAAQSAEILPVKTYAAQLIVPNRVESVRPATAFLVQTARALNVALAEHPLFEVAVTEALANAVKYGHAAQPEHDVIRCEIELDARSLTIRIIDGGHGFAVPDPALPRIPTDVQRVPESGYGLPIIQSVFSSVHAVRRHGQFTLELCLHLA
jgi:anti-sigma regulatory factor (Ser/Thr protein kinase)